MINTHFSCKNCLNPSIPINNKNTEQPSQRLKTVNKIWGAILAFFGAAIKVEKPCGNIVYITMSELREKLLINNLQNTTQLEAEKLRKDKIINNIIPSIIHPIKKSTVSLQTLKKFQQKVIEANLDYNSSNPKLLHASLHKIRAAMYNQQEMTTDQEKFISNIQLGDIIFHRTAETTHSDIVQLQQLTDTIGLGVKHRDGINHNHVYMCAKVDKFGKKWFAEAAWPSGKEDEIRLISEDDTGRCFLKQNKGAITELFRCKIPDLAEKAALEARNITTKLKPQEKDSDEKQPTKLRYSINGGAKALFFSNRFGYNAKVQLFRQILFRNKKGIPDEFLSQPKALFCSSLVGYAYQTAEARPIVKQLLDENLKKKLTPHIMAFKHGKELDEKIQTKFDYKLTTPADLYSWLQEHSELFTAVQSYQQPDNSLM